MNPRNSGWAYRMAELRRRKREAVPKVPAVPKIVTPVSEVTRRQYVCPYCRKQLSRGDYGICPWCRVYLHPGWYGKQEKWLGKKSGREMNTETKNPIRHTKEGWFWGNRGPFTTRKKAVSVARAVYAGGYRGHNPTLVIPIKSKKQIVNPFIPGITKCYFCSTRFPECPEIYTYRSKHGQPFIFCQHHHARYITKPEAEEILTRCSLEPIVVSSVAEGKKIALAKSAGRTIASAAKATTEAGIMVAPVVAKVGLKTIQVVAKVGAKVLPVVAKAGAKTVIGIAKLEGKAVMAVGRLGVRTSRALPSPLSLPEYTSMPTFSTDSSIGISPDGIPLVGRVTEMASVNNPRKITEVFILESKNPTLVIPIKSKKQMEHLFRAQSQLSKAGVTFDTGTNISPMQRHWELDWSLKGGYMKNPRIPKKVFGRREYRLYGTTTSSTTAARQKGWLELRGYHVEEEVEHGVHKLWTIPALKWVSDVELTKLYPGRIVKLENPKRNPTTQTIGNILGGLGILTIPLFIGVIVWLNNRYAK